MAGATHGGPNTIRVRGCLKPAAPWRQTERRGSLPGTRGCPSGTEFLPRNEDVLILDHGGAP